MQISTQHKNQSLGEGMKPGPFKKGPPPLSSSLYTQAPVPGTSSMDHSIFLVVLMVNTLMVKK